VRRALFVAIVLLVAIAAQAAPIAFVADLRGNATIEGDGKVEFLAQLSAGTKLLLGTGATVAVTFAGSGAEFTLQGPGAFVVTDNEVRTETGAVPAKRMVTKIGDPAVLSRVSRLATASLRMRSAAPSAPGASVLEYPVDTRVTSLQPTLKWRGERLKEGYLVSVADAAGKEVWKGTSQPAMIKTGLKLAPGMRYTWSVATPKAAVGTAQFETLSAEAAARLPKSRPAGSFAERVSYALLLEEVGATQEAREAWAALARERPDMPELAALAR
jgi:hypothetical protein